MDKSLKAALRIALIYLLVAGAWIVFSDRVLLLFVHTQAELARLQTYKGLGFVFVMALLLLLERWRHQRALALSEANYRLLFNSYPQSLWVFDQLSFRIMEVNESAVRAYGYEGSAFARMSALELFLPEDQALVRSILGGQAEKVERPGVMRHCKRDGTVIWVEISTHPLRFKERDAIIMLAVDVSERVVAQQQLAEASSKLEQLAFIVNQSTTVAVRWLVRPDWPVAFISDNITRYGYKPEEFYSGALNFNAIVHPDDVKRINDDAWQQVENGVTDFSQEYRIITRGGEARWMENRIWVWWGPDGDARYADGILVDVTARNQAEAELRDTRRFLESLLDHAPLPIFVDSDDNRVRLVNRAWIELFSITREETIGKRLDELFGENAATMIASNQRIIREGNPQFTEEVLTGNDGLEHTFQTIKFGLRNEDGVVTAVGGMMLDITFRKQSELAMQEAARVLERRVEERTAQLQNANQELEAFSYSVSHDLRAPLRALNSFTRYLTEQESGVLSQDGQHYVSLISQSAREMTVLIDDLLEFSRLSRQPLVKKRIDMTALVRNCLSTLALDLSGHSLEVTVGDLQDCYGDPSLLRQVWMNLLSNAIKFTRRQAQGRIEVSCEKQAGQAVYSVRDNGVGFDMHYADRLFNVFQRLHSADEFEGTGVGLAIVQRIIQRHGGSVWANAEPEKGASFYFALPCNPDTES